MIIFIWLYLTLLSSVSYYIALLEVFHDNTMVVGNFLE